MSVIYKPIPGCEGYFAGTDGTVISTLQGSQRKLVPTCRPIDGRKRFTVRVAGGKFKKFYASHLVLMAFVGPRPKGMEACHGDGDCLNDSLPNLRWDTTLENHRDMIRHGTQVTGEKHPKCKMSDVQVSEAIELRRSGISLSQVAKRYGVSPQRIYQIAKKGAR